MEVNSINEEGKNAKKQTIDHIIRVAILAEEPLNWGSGKHFFPVILHQYNWRIHDVNYHVEVKNIYDKDIVTGKLTTKEYDVLLVPGGGVGDGHAIMKGFNFLRKVRKWKKSISKFIEEGGGYVGICGGAALLTDLQTENNKHMSLLEKQYHRSSLGVSCVSSYYNTLTLPLIYPFQKKHPEKIGAIGYVFSFAPGETSDGVRIHCGGAPLDFQICKNHPLFADFAEDKERIRWWGGPALIVPEKPDREIMVLARYPTQDISEDDSLRIHAWYYNGGIIGLVHAFFKALWFIKKEKESLKNVFLFTYFLAGKWVHTDRVIKLDYANKPSITAEIYPNHNKARILLCTSHPEYMVWWGGQISKQKKTTDICIGNGLYQWEGITPLHKHAVPEITHTWWMIRRFVAWAAKVPDEHLPPLQNNDMSKKEMLVLSKNIYWDGTMKNQIENI